MRGTLYDLCSRAFAESNKRGARRVGTAELRAVTTETGESKRGAHFGARLLARLRMNSRRAKLGEDSFKPDYNDRMAGFVFCLLVDAFCALSNGRAHHIRFMIPTQQTFTVAARGPRNRSECVRRGVYKHDLTRSRFGAEDESKVVLRQIVVRRSRKAQRSKSASRQIKPQPPPSSLTASTSSLRPFLRGR